MLSKSFSTAGKSALITIGAVYGLLRGLLVLGDATRNTAAMETLDARIDTAYACGCFKLAEQTSSSLQNKLDQMVTKDDLSQRLDRIFVQMEQGVDARFEHQIRSVEALRMMVGQTDELLQRV